MCRRLRLAGVFFGAACAGACVTEEGGTALDLTVAGVSGNRFEDEARLRTVEGEVVALDAAWVVIAQVEIFLCPETLAQSIGRALGTGWRLQRAWAHVADTPTRVGAPLVFPLTASPRRLLGTLTPPPGRYCRALVILGPADFDARELPGEGAIGTTLHVQGRWLLPDTTPAVTVQSDAVRTLEVALFDGDGAPGIEVRDDGQRVSVTLELDYGTLLDGVYPDAGDIGSASADAALARITASVQDGS